jgi:hypothetical protein
VTEPVLSPRHLNRATLARQLLLKRSSLGLTPAVERVAGLQTQSAPSGYIGLWARLREFRRPALSRALEQRHIVQGTLMRVTIHMVSARDYRLFAAGLRNGRRTWWLRTHGQAAQGLDMEAVAERLRAHLKGGPRRAPELKELLEAEGFPSVAWSGAGLWLDMVRVPPCGTWDRRRADLYGLAEDWLGAGPVTEAEGLAHLVRRYLGGFGPAPLKDVASWVGLPVTAIRPVVERLVLRRFRSEDGAELFDLPRAPLPDADVPAPVRLLAVWDPTLLASMRRTRILPDEYRSLVFNARTPQSVATFLVDGLVAGSWRYQDGKVVVEPFAPLPRVARRELEDEAARLAGFHDAD